MALLVGIRPHFDIVICSCFHWEGGVLNLIGRVYSDNSGIHLFIHSCHDARIYPALIEKHEHESKSIISTHPHIQSPDLNPRQNLWDVLENIWSRSDPNQPSSIQGQKEASQQCGSLWKPWQQWTFIGQAVCIKTRSVCHRSVMTSVLVITKRVQILTGTLQSFAHY